MDEQTEQPNGDPEHVVGAPSWTTRVVPEWEGLWEDPTEGVCAALYFHGERILQVLNGHVEPYPLRSREAPAQIPVCAMTALLRRAEAPSERAGGEHVASGFVDVGGVWVDPTRVVAIEPGIPRSLSRCWFATLIMECGARVPTGVSAAAAVQALGVSLHTHRSSPPSASRTMDLLKRVERGHEHLCAAGVEKRGDIHEHCAAARAEIGELKRMLDSANALIAEAADEATKLERSRGRALECGPPRRHEGMAPPTDSAPGDTWVDHKKQEWVLVGSRIRLWAQPGTSAQGSFYLKLARLAGRRGTGQKDPEVIAIVDAELLKQADLLLHRYTHSMSEGSAVMHDPTSYATGYRCGLADADSDHEMRSARAGLVKNADEVSLEIAEELGGKHEAATTVAANISPILSRWRQDIEAAVHTDSGNGTPSPDGDPK